MSTFAIKTAGAAIAAWITATSHDLTFHWALIAEALHESFSVNPTMREDAVMDPAACLRVLALRDARLRKCRDVLAPRTIALAHASLEAQGILDAIAARIDAARVKDVQRWRLNMDEHLYEISIAFGRALDVAHPHLGKRVDRTAARALIEAMRTA